MKETTSNRSRNVNRSLNNLTYDLTVKELGLGDDGLEEAMTYIEKLRAKLAYTERVLKIRAAVRKDFAPQFNSRLISLGYNCLPRTVPAKYGLVEPRSMGRRTCPFDLAVHPLKHVSRLLEEEFATYKNPAAYRLNGSNLPTIFGNSVIFNHDTDEALHQAQFAGLIGKNILRARAFQDYGAAPNAHFVINARNSDVPHLDALLNVVDRKYPHALSTVFILDVEPQHYDIPETLLEKVECHPIELPYDGYLWHRPEHYASDAGIAFETKLIKPLFVRFFGADQTESLFL